MFKDEADFEKIVGRLNLDDQPNQAHREKLRRQMLSVFDEASKESAGRATQIQAKGRTIVKYPLVKFAAAAAILIVALISVHQLRKPDKTAIVAKDGRIDGSEAVHIGTPDLAPIELDLPRLRSSLICPGRCSLALRRIRGWSTSKSLWAGRDRLFWRLSGRGM